MNIIYPRCKEQGAQIYVSADGFVTPCCWIGSANIIKELKEFFGSEYETLSIKNRSLDEVLNGPSWQKIENSWSTSTPFSSCTRYCSKPFTEVDSLKGTNRQTRIRLNQNENNQK